MARKVDEAANFVFVQLIEQDDKRHPDYARQDKIDVAWERISHGTKESGSRLSSFETIKNLSLNCQRRTDAPSVFFS
jgi:hypothetical protein